MSRPMIPSASVHSLAEGSEIISEVDEIHEVKNLQGRGDRAFLLKDYDTAIQFYTEALEMDDKNLEVLQCRAAAFCKKEEYNHAQADARRLISLNPKYPQGHYLLAVCLDRRQSRREALLEYISTLELDLEHADQLVDSIASAAEDFCHIPERLAKQLYYMDPFKKLSEVGACLLTAKKYDLCVKVLNAAQKIKTNQKGIQMKVLLTLAHAHSALKHVDLAISLYQECLHLAMSNHDYQYQTKSIINLATLFQERGDIHQAIVYYEKLIDIEKELRFSEMPVDTYPDFWTWELQCGLHLNLSIAYKSVGRMENAVKHANMYLDLLESMPSSQEELHSESLHNVGALHEILGKFDDAIKYYKKFYRSCREQSKKRGMLQAYLCLGNTYASLHNWALSRTYHEQALAIAKKLDDSALKCLSLQHMGDVFMKQDCCESAIEIFGEMLENCTRDDDQNRSTAFLKIGSAFRSLEKYQYSEYYFEESLSIAKQAGLEDVVFQCEYNLACVLQYSSQTMELERSRKLLQKLIPIIEGKIKRCMAEDTLCPEQFYEELAECYTALQNVLSKVGSKEDCLLYTEAYRKRQISQKMPSMLSPSLAGYSALGSRLLDQNMWTMDKVLRVASQQNSTVLYYSVLPSCYLVWVVQPGAGVVRFYSGRPPKGTLMTDCISGLLKEVKREINYDDLLLSCENRALPSRTEYLSRIRKRNEQLAMATPRIDDTATTSEAAATPTDQDESSRTVEKPPGRRLFDLLLAPIDDVIGQLEKDSHLIICADKMLAEVPFELITDWGGTPLYERYRITYVQSLYLLDRSFYNELNQLKVTDDIEFTRQRAKYGGLGPELRKAEAHSLPPTPRHPNLQPEPETLDVSEVRGREVSNPRLLTSGVLQNQPRASRKQNLSMTPRSFDWSSTRTNTRPSPTHRTLTFRETPMAKTPPPFHTHKDLEMSRRARKPIGAPAPMDTVLHLGTLDTLVSNTSTGTDIVTSSCFVTTCRQISRPERSVVIGAPKLPKKLRYGERDWTGHTDLQRSSQEINKVAALLGVDAISCEEATKERFLKEIQSATLLHIATFMDHEEGSLVMSPNPHQMNSDNSTHAVAESVYLVTAEEVLRVPLKNCRVVVLCGGWSNRPRDEDKPVNNVTGSLLPSVFLAAGAQCVLSLLWPVPDAALQKFLFYFYETLHSECHVTSALKRAQNKLRQDDRFASPVYWAAFVLYGYDVSLSLADIQQSMLDQKLDKTQDTASKEKGQCYLNPEPVTPEVSNYESSLLKVQEIIAVLLRNHSSQPDMISSLVDLLDSGLKRLHVPENNASSARLPHCVAVGVGGLELLKLLNYHFQAVGAQLKEPFVVFPHSNPDKLMVPTYEALRALCDLTSQDNCYRELEKLIPMQQEKISYLVDLLALTKHAPEIQLKVSDLSIIQLWKDQASRAFLLTLGFKQIGMLLSFNRIASNRKLLNAALQLTLSVSAHKSALLLHKLEVDLLGPQPAQRGDDDSTSSSQITRLPSLTPVIIPHKQLRMSTPWSSAVEKQDEMQEKMKLVRSQKEMSIEYIRQKSRAKTWHQTTLSAQAQEALDKIGRPTTTPLKMKMQPESVLSRQRVELDQLPELTNEVSEQRRDYAHYVIKQRLDLLGLRQRNDLRKSYQPYIEQSVQV